jgi:LPXTG-motif cell wall-anchored protein
MNKIKRVTSIIIALVLLLAFASVSFAADSYTLKPVKSAFNYGADVNFKYTGAVNAKDWIGIYEVGETPSGSAPSIIWAYVGDPNKPDGTSDFAKAGQASKIAAIADLPKGKYEAKLCKDDGYEVAATAKFEVLYNAGEAIPEGAAAENPKTGDSGLLVSVVALVLAAAGIMFFRKKALN